MCAIFYNMSCVIFPVGMVGTTEEDLQMTQLLKDEEVQISNRIDALKRDVRLSEFPSQYRHLIGTLSER